MAQKIVIYTDGGSRGNPGPAALGIYFETIDKKYAEFIGTGTNNEAEYKAIVAALKKCKQYIGTEKAKSADIEIRSDSQLVVSQLNGVYRVKEDSLWPYFMHIWNLKQEYKSVLFTYIPREKNKVADALLNECLDEHAREARSRLV